MDFYDIIVKLFQLILIAGLLCTLIALMLVGVHLLMNLYYHIAHIQRGNRQIAQRNKTWN